METTRNLPHMNLARIAASLAAYSKDLREEAVIETYRLKERVSGSILYMSPDLVWRRQERQGRFVILFEVSVKAFTPLRIELGLDSFPDELLEEYDLNRHGGNRTVKAKDFVYSLLIRNAFGSGPRLRMRFAGPGRASHRESYGADGAVHPNHSDLGRALAIARFESWIEARSRRQAFELLLELLLALWEADARFNWLNDSVIVLDRALPMDVLQWSIQDGKDIRDAWVMQDIRLAHKPDRTRYDVFADPCLPGDAAICVALGHSAMARRTASPPDELDGTGSDMDGATFEAQAVVWEAASHRCSAHQGIGLSPVN